MATTLIPSCTLGATLTFEAGDPAPDGVEPGSYRWCNTHLAVGTAQHVAKHAITVDPAHPLYGTPVTLQYPSDSYGFVVIGGSKSGHRLFVAPIDSPNDLAITSKAEALAWHRLTGIRVISRKANGWYGEYSLGVARNHRSREL